VTVHIQLWQVLVDMFEERGTESDVGHKVAEGQIGLKTRPARALAGPDSEVLERLTRP
jgi:hypothetical protein